jgi:predicted alpha-1,2-mannosidase
VSTPLSATEPPADHVTRRPLRSGVRPILTLALSVALVATGLGSVPEAFAQFVAQATASTTSEDFTQYVDPFVSTEDDFGQDLPGAQAPHGLAKVNPMTTPGRSHSGYDYAVNKIAGFTTTDLDGVGGSGGGGDILVVPTYVSYTKRPATSSYAKGYSHDDEEAAPGYYRVALTTTQGSDGSVSDVAGSQPIQAELTADVRTAVERYTFPNAGTASLVVDLQNNFTSRVTANLTARRLADGRAAISGYVVGAFNGPSYTLYYYAETTRPVKAIRTWGPDGALTSATSRTGADVGAVLDFDVAAGDQVGLTATLSPISVDQATTDMANELGARTFDEVRADTKAQWNDVLSRVAVDASATSDPDGTLEELFYTHLYRLFALPVNATSTVGTYRGVDGVIYQTDGTHYDSWSLWDDFRKYSVLALVAPQDYRDVVQSLVDLYASFANTSAGSLGSLMQSVPTVRFERAPVVVADAVSKGVRLDQLDLAFAGLARQVGTGYDAANTARGYLADDVDDTLGTAYDDWAMSVIADALGRGDDASSYRQRATNYTNLFNTAAWTNPAGEQVGLIYPKNASGAWWSGVDLEQFQAANLYQGTPWQYNWYVASDMGGMVELMGGRENALSAVSYLFGEQAPDDGSRMLHSNANEIDLQAPYLFNYVGAPSRTQYWVRAIATKATWNRYIATDSTGEAPSSGGEFRPPVKTNVFTLGPQGFLPTMDNDAGTMSATFVADALGLFPVTAGSDTYQIGSPIFDRVTIDRRDGGRPFTIVADGVSADSFYVQSAQLDGASLDRTWVRYGDVVGGGELRFQMGADPSQWAADGPQPDSLSDHVDSAVYDKRGTSSLTTSTRVFDEAAANDGTVATTVTVTARGTTFAGADGTDLAAGGAVTATGIPAGLTLRAVKASDETVELSLVGTAAAHTGADSGDLGVAFGASALTSAVDDDARALALRVAFTGYTLTAGDLTVPADEAGVVGDTTTLTLGGGASFAGATGSDLLATGAAQVTGLADGLAATLTRTGDTTADLTVTGTLATVGSSRFTLTFADTAFAGGVAATSVTGDGGVLRPFTVAVGADWRARLADLYAQAHLEQRGAYSATSFAALTGALAKAQVLLGDPGAPSDALRQAYFTLSSALDGLEIGQGGYRRLEGEASDTWSGGELKNEAANLGGVKPGSWVGYLGMDFDEPPASIEVSYATNAGRAPADSAVEIHVDAPDGPLAGTVALPRNGSDWFAFSKVTYRFDDPSVLADADAIYFVFRGSVTDDLPWVTNVDYFQFEPAGAGAPAFGNLDTTNASELHPGIDKSAPMFQNVNDQEWAAYRGHDFGAAGAATLTVDYDKPSTRTTSNTSVEVRLGSMDAAASAVVPLSFTGSGWGTYTTTTVDVDPAVFRGVQDVYFVFRAPEADSGHPYVANIPWLRFGAPTTPAATKLHLEAESFAASSGGALGTETNTDPSGVPYVNLKGTGNGDWLRYDGVDFGANTATSVTVRYVNNSSRCGANSRIEVYLDAREGDPAAVVPLPVTGSAWSAIGTTTFTLPTALTGAHTLFLVLRTEPDAGHPYVANIDWLDFGYGVDLGPLRAAIAEYQPLAQQADRYLPADFRTFTQALDAAVALVDDPAVTAEAATAATRTLRLAAGQLEWKVVRQLAELVGQSQAVDRATVSGDSYAALATALGAALGLAPDAAYDEYQQAYATLRGAYDGLVHIAPQGSVTGSAAPGGRLELAAAGLAPSTPYALYLHSDPVLLGTGTSDADGALTLAVDLPADVAVGDHTLTLETDDRTVVLSVPIVVQARSGSEELLVMVPEHVPGDFHWTIDGHNGLVDLGSATAVGDHYEATGTINPIRVSDTRGGAPGWSVSAQVSDFASDEESFSGRYLGWAPKVVEAGGGVEAGAPVASGLAGGDGLSVPALLGRAAGGHLLGSAVLGADLSLRIPGDTPPDDYRARLTLTALS